MIAVIGLVIGALLGVFFQPDVPVALQPYLPIAVVAALDAIFGGLRALLDGIFDDKVFVVSFVSNVLIAALIVWVGDLIGVGTQLSTAVVVVLGIRIFTAIWRVPGIRQLQEALYGWVAAHRSAMPGTSPWCVTHPGDCDPAAGAGSCSGR